MQAVQDDFNLLLELMRKQLWQNPDSPRNWDEIKKQYREKLARKLKKQIEVTN